MSDTLDVKVDAVPAARPSPRASGQVQSLSRALWLMNALADATQGLSLSEVAHRVQLPTSTAHRLLTTLQNEKYVSFEADRSAWLIGVQAFQVGSAFIRERDIVTVARPYMRRLMEASGETANLGIFDRDEVIYLAQVECQKMMRAIAGPGGRAHLHCSGIGKALLAHMAGDDMREVVARRGLPRETPKTISDMTALEAEVARIRQDDYAVDDEEYAIGLRCVASIIFDEHGEPLAGLSISGPTARLTDNRLPGLGKLVAGVADDITRDAGGRRPAPGDA